MKRFVLFFVLALPIILLMGCDYDSPPSENAQTQVVAGLTIAAYTPTFVPTRHPNEMHIVEIINDGLRNLEDPLSIALDAKITVIEAYLIIRPGQSDPTILSLEVYCECARNGSCCNVEHTFVMVARAMKSKGIDLIAWVPLTVTDFQVYCYDHQTPIGPMSTHWVMMHDYILGHIDGYQLGGTIITATPVP